MRFIMGFKLYRWLRSASFFAHASSFEAAKAGATSITAVIHVAKYFMEWETGLGLF